MKILHRFLFVAIILLVGNAYSMSLSEAVKMAILNSNVLKSSDAAIAAQQYKAKSVYKLNYPSLSTSYGYTRMKTRSSVGQKPFVVYMNHHNNFRWDLNLQMPIFTGFKLSYTYKLEKIGVDIKRLKKKEATLDIIYNVSKSYYGVLFAEKMKNVMQARVRSLKAHLKDAEKFYEAGVIPKNDLLKSKTAELSAVQAMESAENTVLLAKSNLNRLLGRDFGSKLDLVDVADKLSRSFKIGKLRGSFDVSTEKKLETYARRHRPVLSEIRHKITKLRYAQKIAASSYYPQVGIKANYNREGNHFDVSKNEDITFYPYRNASIGVQANWELFNWGKTSDEIDMYRSQQISVAFIERDISNKIALGVEKAFLNTKLSYNNLKSAKAEVIQAKENFRITNLRYKNGITTSTELLDAEGYLVGAKAHYYEALYDYFINLSLLKRQVGVK